MLSLCTVLHVDIKNLNIYTINMFIELFVISFMCLEIFLKMFQFNIKYMFKNYY